MTTSRPWLGGALFALAFGGTVFLTAPVLPPPAHLTAVKQRHLEAHADDYTAVFFGSSRTYRQFVPATFEKEISKRGHVEHAFNFGVQGMEVPEALHALRAFLRTDPANLRWVFVELHGFSTGIDARNALSDREVAWHDGASTALAAEAILEGSASWLGKAGLLADQTRHLLHRETLVGRARPLLPGWVDAAEALPDGDVVGTQGWVPLEAERGLAYTRRRDDYLENMPLFHKRLGEFRERQELAAASPDHPDLPTLSAYERLCLEEINELVAAHDGARLVYVIMPLLRDETQFKRAHDEGLISHLLVLNDLAAFGSLYEPEARFDRAHLTRVASKELTRRMVRELEAVVGLDR
jgi:hypothetical protein